MRIGIDGRGYGSTYGYMGKYAEALVTHISKHTDAHEYVLIVHDQELNPSILNCPRLQVITIPTGLWKLGNHLYFTYELYRAKLDAMLFMEPKIPVFYVKKSIIIVPDLLSYFYPSKHAHVFWARHVEMFFLRRSIRKASHIITLSKTLKRDLIEIFNIHEDLITHIPPIYVPLRIWKAVTAKNFFAQEHLHEKYILSVWELREYKNIPRLLRAYHSLLEQEKIDMDLVLVGKEDVSYHEIRSIVISLGLQNRVHIYNMIDEETMHALYTHASLYILSSLYEGSEQAIIEPLTYHLPIASASLPSITTALEKDTLVTWFRPMSVPDITDACKRILTSDIRTHASVDLSEYSPSVICAKLLEVFTLCAWQNATQKMNTEAKNANL